MDLRPARLQAADAEDAPTRSLIGTAVDNSAINQSAHQGGPPCSRSRCQSRDVDLLLIAMTLDGRVSILTMVEVDPAARFRGPDQVHRACLHRERCAAIAGRQRLGDKKGRRQSCAGRPAQQSPKHFRISNLHDGAYDERSQIPCSY